MHLATTWAVRPVPVGGGVVAWGHPGQSPNVKRNADVHLRVV